MWIALASDFYRNVLMQGFIYRGYDFPILTGLSLSPLTKGGSLLEEKAGQL